VLLVEQNIQAALTVANRHHIIDKGQIVYEGTTDELVDDESVQQQYLGVSTAESVEDG
jgi:branched-chain amino acid transport system ATP-binding protein